jgi:phosphatidate phosphatase PAH1
MPSSVDIIVVKRKDGTLHSSPWFVHFTNKRKTTEKPEAVRLFVDGKSFYPRFEIDSDLRPILFADQGYMTFMSRKYMMKNSNKEPECMPLITERDIEGVHVSVKDVEPLSAIDESLNGKEKESQGLFSDAIDGLRHRVHEMRERHAGHKEMKLKHVPAYRLITPDDKFLQQLGLTKEVTNIAFEARGARTEARIFLWKDTDKIIVSDVDGTITKTDPNIAPTNYLGFERHHHGVAELFSKLERRGYKMLYLITRPMDMHRNAREHLESVRQGGNKLPVGPLITSPHLVSSVLFEEVGLRRAQYFKISILSFIATAFDDRFQSDIPKYTPFVGGFGSRVSDDMVYTAVGISAPQIFRIDPKTGKITGVHGVFDKGYAFINHYIDLYFKPLFNESKQ